MLGWLHLLLVVGSIAFVTSLSVLFIWRCVTLRQHKQNDLNKTSPPTTTTQSLQEGIAKLHQASLHHQLELDSKRRGNYYVFRRGVSSKPLFNWSDHPSLITDAVENGWSRFAFSAYMSSPSTRSSLLMGLCSAGDYGRGSQTEFTWEVCQGSADFMQKIRLNSGLKKANHTNNSSVSAASVIRTALPLPGPPLGNSAFPQEAYFEITILSSCCDGDDIDKSNSMSKEGEKAKLIQDHSVEKTHSESLVHVSSSHRINKIEELKLSGNKEEDRSEPIMLSIGLTAGGSLPTKLPGSYPGSIGFNSNGSVYLDGMKLVLESETTDWTRTEKVIGCGFDPRQKKVFFTVDAELVHVIDCKSEEFGTPLYPTIAANNDMLILVNFGQSVFSYGPANSQRTPNPCFIGPLVNSPALGYEDSKELFSMGRIDSQWLNRCTTKSGHNIGINNIIGVDFDEESEADDLFEIVLDKNSGKSPHSVQ